LTADERHPPTRFLRYTQDDDTQEGRRPKQKEKEKKNTELNSSWDKKEQEKEK
jgi:hypothetical protein